MTYFNKLEDLKLALSEKRILVFYRNLDDYPGMVLALSIYYKQNENYFGIDLRWQCLGLDLYGDSLEESYEYAFENLDALLAYLAGTYQVKLEQIPLNYSFDLDKFPNPLKDKEKKDIYNKAWGKFQNDFEKDQFLDKTLLLVYSSK